MYEVVRLIDTNDCFYYNHWDTDMQSEVLILFSFYILLPIRSCAHAKMLQRHTLKNCEKDGIANLTPKLRPQRSNITVSVSL